MAMTPFSDSERNEARAAYDEALKLGQAYYRNATQHGAHPYPLVLDEMVDFHLLAGRTELGIIDIPTDLIIGTKTAGRTFALAGNFMPLLPASSEFGTKWLNLCLAHLSNVGIRDPIECFEYLGRFYVQEGNKRVSVLRAYRAPSIPCNVTRLIPEYSDDPAIRIYYEFMAFYKLAGTYEIQFTHPGDYDRLLALLGMAPDHIWTDKEKRSFHAGYTRFRELFAKSDLPAKGVLPTDALLEWLSVFGFHEVKDLGSQELVKMINTLSPELTEAGEEPHGEVSTAAPAEEKKTGLARLFGGAPAKVTAGFIYARAPEESVWTQAHDLGRAYAETQMDGLAETRCYLAADRRYFEAMETARLEGCQVIFATTVQMETACRRFALLHPEIKVLLCALTRPHAGIRSYYFRTYECKFITGAIAGAMAENDRIGYVANYPILGVPADINAFALGVRMTNPRAQIDLKWSCTEGDPVRELMEDGVRVISNRMATDPQHIHRALEWGTYTIGSDDALIPLALPSWNWGPLYLRVLRQISTGMWNDTHAERPSNYWWGLESGVVDLTLGSALPYGIRSLAEYMRRGILHGHLDPFHTKVFDREGTLRLDGITSPTVDELLSMDWLADNVNGSLPPWYALLPYAQEVVRGLGIHRDDIPAEDALEDAREPQL